MRLVHYSRAPVPGLQSRSQKGRRSDKPDGFWVSDDACEDSWPAWCKAERFRPERLTHVHDVTLKRDARILHLAGPADIDLFTCAYAAPDKWRSYPIDWGRVAEQYQGIIITPYVLGRRLDGNAGWYYGWDCASWCIWDISAIESVTLREVVPEPFSKETADA